MNHLERRGELRPEIKKGEYLDMGRRLLALFLATTALTVMSVSVWAKNDSGDSITVDLKLTAPTNIGTIKLAPGEYKVVVDGSKAKFEQGKKVVAEVPCSLKDYSSKMSQPTFIIENDQLTEIQIGGKSKAIDFPGN
jgi:hypothetical protein